MASDAGRGAGSRILHLGDLVLDLALLADRAGPVRLEARCGARTRAGLPCRAPAMRSRLGRPRIVGGLLLHTVRYGRCRMHGGASTGPKTPEGRAAIAASNRRRAKVAQGATRRMGSGRPGPDGEA